MTGIILDISRYLIITIFVVFTLSVYYSIMIDSKKGRKLAGEIQLGCVFALQFVGNLAIALNTSLWKTLIFYLLQVAFLIGYYVATIEFYDGMSKVVFNITSMLFTVGIIMITRLDTGLAYRQFLMILIAVVISLIIPSVIERFKGGTTISILCGILGLIGLVLVLVLGDVERGAKLSLVIGDFSIQISEFVKISFVIMCAGFFKDGADKKNIAICTVFAALHVIVLVLSRDLGAALLLGGVYLFILFIATYNYGVLVLGAFGVGVCGFFAYQFFPHVQTRIDVWIDPWKDALDDGWQVLQSLFAIGTGDWTGLGLLGGSPNSIPIVTTDFIFAAISEEMGGIVAVCIILIYLALIMKVMLQAVSIKEEFAKLLVAGFGCIIGVQTILNIGGIIKFIPSTGITLPLISYGRSSILSMFIILGLIQGYNVTKHKKKTVKRKG